MGGLNFDLPRISYERYGMDSYSLHGSEEASFIVLCNTEVSW